LPPHLLCKMSVEHRVKPGVWRPEIWAQQCHSALVPALKFDYNISLFICNKSNYNKSQEHVARNFCLILSVLKSWFGILYSVHTVKAEREWSVAASKLCGSATQQCRNTGLYGIRLIRYRTEKN
jgi:hypothetical protein